MKLSDGFCMADSRNLPRVDYMMLLQYMRENESFNVAEIRGAKIMLSSRESYVETAVGYVEVKRENSMCFVNGRITPEHRVRSKMYSVTASINELQETITEVKCQDCAASEGGCKHSICFVMWLIRRTDEPSLTSVSCYWAKPKLSSAVTEDKFILAKEMGRTQPSDVTLPNSLKLTNFIDECKKHNIVNSMMLNYSLGTKTLAKFSIFHLLLDFTQSSTCNDYEKFKQFAQEKLTSEIANAVEENTRHQAESQLWHTLRQGRVTASKIYECTKCKTPDGALVKSILGGYKVPETKAISRGKRLEKDVVKEIEKSMDLKIDQCGLQLITPIIGASPDGVCKEQGFTIEIKCPMSTRTVGNYIKDNIISEKCKAQVQVQMLATGCKKALFCVADPNFEDNKMFSRHWLFYDSLYVNKLLTEAEQFWMRNIFPKMLGIVQD